MKQILSTLVFIGFLLIGCLAFGAEPLPPDPVYMRIDNGWRGFYARNDEFLEYSVEGKEVELQDAYHVLIKPGLGLMVTFAKKENFGADKDVLKAHRQWEVEYWRKNSNKVDVADRSDLRSARRDVMVTELGVHGKNADQFLSIYLITLASKDGVYVFAISPASRDNDELVKSFIRSIKLINKRFDVKKENDKIRRGIEDGQRQ